ncbi:WYL domain-containing protein [Olivibacter ginsenosidimutans]|uniref:WYL domain-containing protein n=1 Tax=Olivibacter ginsenosidimutans TaxID=1176537 RepID=A0ABP9BWJ1_9SPHI
MATNKHAIIRYEALDRCFSNKGRKFFIDDLITYVSAAIEEYSGSKASISRRQIFKDMDFMRSEAGFRAPIESYKEGKKTYYRYSDRSYSLAMQQINPVEADLLKTTLDMLGRFKGLPQFDFVQELALKLKKSFQLEDLGDCIFFDQNEYLKNLHLLGDLLKIIQDKRVLYVRYQSFNQNREKSFLFHPYFLKQYNKRWFLFGQREDFENWSSLALDRIIDFSVEYDEVYKPANIHPDDYFEDLIGVSKPTELTAQLVRIKINKSLWPYIDSKPLHPSQKILEKKEDYTIIQLDVIPNYEFYAQILSFGQAIEVIAPESVRLAIKEKLIAMLDRYS